ncbi:hypothetical protein V6N13_122153 [Hibiscus sabdariffa]
MTRRCSSGPTSNSRNRDHSHVYDTLKGALYDLLIGQSTISFADIVMNGKRIEDAIRKGKITISNNTTPQRGA